MYQNVSKYAMMHHMTINPIKIRSENTYLVEKTERLLTIISSLLKRIDEQDQTINTQQTTIRTLTLSLVVEEKS